MNNIPTPEQVQEWNNGCPSPASIETAIWIAKKAYATGVASMQPEIDSLSSQLAMLKESYSELLVDRFSLQVSERKYLAERDALQVKLDEAQAEQCRAYEAISKRNTERDALKLQLADAKKDNLKLRALLDVNITHLDQLKVQLKESDEKANDAINSDAANSTLERTALNNVIIDLTSERDILQAQLTEAKEDLEIAQRLGATIDKLRKQSSSKLDTLQTQLASLMVHDCILSQLLTPEDLEQVKLLCFDKEINAEGEAQEAVNLDQLMLAAVQRYIEKTTATTMQGTVDSEKRNQCGETCERAKVCAICAKGIEPAVQEHVATVAEVHMSRYTIEWNGTPLPEGTKLYADHIMLEPAPALAKELVRLADIIRDCGRLVSSSGKAEEIMRKAAVALTISVDTTLLESLKQQLDNPAYNLARALGIIANCKKLIALADKSKLTQDTTMPDADMFWNFDDAERQYNSIDELLNDEICNDSLEVGAVLTILRGKELPRIRIRVTSIDENESEAEYEVITEAQYLAAQAAQG